MNAQAQGLVFTIGTSNRSAEEFIELLPSHGVEVLVDVRRFPSSRFEHFRQDALAARLSEAGIEYVHMGEELGGRRSGGYQRFTLTAEFWEGVTKLENLAREKRAAIACAERFPWRCHRRFIALELERRGWHVVHILDRGRDWSPRAADESKRSGPSQGKLPLP